MRTKAEIVEITQRRTGGAMIVEVPDKAEQYIILNIVD
jgi:hypothetical protein